MLHNKSGLKAQVPTQGYFLLYTTHCNMPEQFFIFLPYESWQNAKQGRSVWGGFSLFLSSSVQLLLLSLHYWKLASFTFFLRTQGTQNSCTHSVCLNLTPPSKKWVQLCLFSWFRPLSNPPFQNQNLPDPGLALSSLRGVMRHTNAETWLLLLSVRNEWKRVPLKRSLLWFEANTENVFGEEWAPTQQGAPAPCSSF